MKKIITISIFVLLSIISITPATAGPTTPTATGSGGSVPPAPIPPVSLINPLTGHATSKSPEVLIGNIINAVMGIVGSLALAMFIYGGFTWMLAAGNDQRVQKGKEILIWATIGLIVIFSSYALVRLVFKGIGLG